LLLDVSAKANQLSLWLYESYSGRNSSFQTPVLTNKVSNLSNTMAAILCMYKLEPRMQIFLRNPRIACNADHVLQHRWKNKNKNLKSGGDVENSFYIRDLYNHQTFYKF
jgi:hypothetical protein